MYMCVYVCICLRVYMCVYVCICMRVYMCVYVCICVYMCVYVCICVYMCVSVCICVYMCVYVCICMRVYMCVYVCSTGRKRRISRCLDRSTESFLGIQDGESSYTIIVGWTFNEGIWEMPKKSKKILMELRTLM